MKNLLRVFLVSIAFVFLFQSSAFAETVSKRLDGKDRFEVAVKVSQEGWPSGAKTAFLVNYEAFADALSGSPLAFKEDGPILLTRANALETSIINELKRLSPEKVVIIGGTGSVSQNIVTQLTSIGIQAVERVDGKDRYEVALNIANRMGPSDTAVVANGLVFSDALSIAPYAAKNGFPILLAGNNSFPAPMQEALKILNVKNSIISGGEASVTPSVAAQLPNPTRIGGKDRYEVSANIAKQLSPNSEKIFLATGLTFADALTGSVLASKNNAPMLLMHPTNVYPSVKEVATGSNVKEIVVLGGTGSIPQATFLQLISKAPLAGKRIILDAGHGGYDPGAAQNGLLEKNLNIQFTEKLANELKQLGAEVIFTRAPGNDVYISLQDRALYANKVGGDLFVSIHHDSNVSSSPKGYSVHYSSYRPAIDTTDVYVLSSGIKYPFIREDTDRKVFIVQDGSRQRELSYNGPNIAYDPTPVPQVVLSRQFGEGFVKSLAYPGINFTTIYSSTGLKDHNLYVTRWTTMPSVLIELGFISNPDEAKLLQNATIQSARAASLAKSISSTFNQ
ncbi:hypothetical protein A8F94_10805 [Bacillus sp. FJAT-27225]|uniref:cell wall-binding repeat-containing protein n=1 Tax=Bacillus sp. FJAT-27225 TaxID=1743144 RepID=UPI00080C22FA|nr:cell wall-binding repeat-containing protein [Bacillus sp. FJAT-27225]OCA88279.1 hypothetical protein A8F94_10805 [Bacillus sp. FJAT-27225]